MLTSVVCFLLLASQNPAFADLSAQATSARESGDLVGALSLYRRAVDANPAWEEGWWFLGSMSYDADLYAEARDALRHMVALDPAAIAACALLGLSEFETGEYERALTHIQHALKAGVPDPKMEGVLRFHEVLALDQVGRFDAAVKAATWFAQRSVRNPELMLALGLSTLHNRTLPRAVSTEQRPLFLAAAEGAYLALAGDFSGAQQAFASLLRQYPLTPYVHYVYGCFLLAADPDTAVVELRRELDVNPSCAPASAMLAWSFLQRNDFPQALEYSRRSVQLDETVALGQLALGRCLLETGKTAESIAHLERAKHLDPGNLDTRASLAAAYSQAGRVNDARQARAETLAMWEKEDANAAR